MASLSSRRAGPFHSEEKVAAPFDWYLDRAELERRIHRDAADRLSEAIDGARVALIDAFCGAPFETDAAGEVLVSIDAERSIDRALEPLWTLAAELSRKGRRAS
jgi:hypothetical protein